MTKTLSELAEMMKDIDFTMLSTHTEGGAIASRPMSNNGQVEYDGDNYFFALEDTRVVQDIGANPQVSLGFQAKGGLLNMKPEFVSIEGRAELIQDKATFEEHWTKDLEIWFEQGVDTPGLTLIKVHGVRAHYWDGNDEGEVVIDRALANA